MPPPSGPLPRQPQAGVIHAARPVVHVPGLQQVGDLYGILQAPLSGKQGYTEAHERYQKVRQLLQMNALRVGGPPAEVVIIQASMVVMEEKRKTHTAISGVRESIPHVPARIGACDLKALVFATLRPPWIVWSKSTPLKIEECTLRSKGWVELLPLDGMVDRDAISEGLYQTKGTGRNQHQVFKGASKASLSVVVYMEIPLSKYKMALRRQEQSESIEESVEHVQHAPQLDELVTTSATEKILDMPPIEAVLRNGSQSKRQRSAVTYANTRQQWRACLSYQADRSKMLLELSEDHHDMLR
ncbi:hypothetical protein OH76DRAFT_1482511 [Lentinus brumalis]|uniref:Uncharacterized protein n=1 Tax=Lentinus brumalis TaxID=2498619 RepID=A0A371DBT8_9APHY|nr:hypothetical protein OH76DRAFT_1482511 [Polyporus brumalis]